MLVFPLVEVNKLSKVYKQNQNTKVFANVDEAKKHFLTDEAIEQYNKYCYNQKWALADDNTSLHWTITFTLDTKPKDPNYISNSDKWNEAKAKMCENDVWFVKGHWAVIDHNATDLF